MEKRSFGFEETEGGGTWTHLDRSAGQWFAWACGGCLIDARVQPGPQHCKRCGEVTETVETMGALRLDRALRWMLQQLKFGHFRVEDVTENGEVLAVSIGRGIGRGAAPAEETRDSIIENTRERLQTLNLCGLFAQARESGISPEVSDLAEKIRSTATPGGTVQHTEFHYAFELIRILKRIRERSFILDSPPILEKASPWAVSLLGEATRCCLFGFHRASISLCRACMERVLWEKVPKSALLREKWEFRTGKGPLELLVKAAHRLGLLDGPHRDWANEVRLRGNRMLHRKPGEEPEKGPRGSDEDAWEILFAARAVVSHLFR